MLDSSPHDVRPPTPKRFALFDFRPYRPGDEVAITQLFEIVFGRPMSLDFWRWRFLDHPAGGPLIYLGWDRDTLVAHYAVSRAPLSVAGEVRSAGLSMTTMTHPEYRGRRLFEKVGDKLYEYLPENGVGSVFGFPNTMSHPLFILQLGWKDYYEIPTFTLDVTTAQPRPVDPRIKVASAVDARFTRLWNEIAPALPLAGLRDESTLAWRIDRNPVNTYTRLVLEEGDAIVGYAITKPYGDDSLDLVELRCLSNGVAKALVNAVTAKAAAEGRRRISTWSMPGDLPRRALESADYKLGAPVTFFGGRAFRDLGADPSDGRLWRISMLDSDLY